MVDVKPYAQALFEIAQETSKEELYKDQLKKLSQIWKENPELILLLKHPKVTHEQKKEVLQEIISEEDEGLQRFIYVCNSYDVAAYLPEIYRLYVSAYYKAMNIEIVKVKSASELEPSQQEALTDVLSKKLNKKVELSIQVDPSLIAGLRVQTQEFVLDNTVVSKVQAMKEEVGKE